MKIPISKIYKLHLMMCVGLLLVVGGCADKVAVLSEVGLKIPEAKQSVQEDSKPTLNELREQEGKILRFPAESPTDSASELQPTEEILPATPTPFPTQAPDEIWAELFSSAPALGRSSSPAATSGIKDVSVLHNTTLNGRVYDAGGFPLDGVEITVSSLVLDSSYQERAITQGGVYVFNAVPAGISLSVKAIKEPYRTVEQVVVLKSNTQGDPQANTIDFGGSHPDSQRYFMAAGPEIISVAPGHQKHLEAAEAYAISMTFSKPVNMGSVAANLRLSAMAPLATYGTIFAAADETVLLGNSGFRFDWNSEQTAVTAYLSAIPVSSKANQTVAYQISFQGPFQGADGTLASIGSLQEGSFSSGPFLIDNHFRSSIVFEIEPDTTRPQINRVAHQGNHLNLEMSERIRYSIGQPVRQIFNPTIATASNYKLGIDTNQDNINDTFLEPNTVNVLDQSISVVFGDLSAFIGKTATLQINNPELITDVAGNALALNGAIRLVL